MCVFQPGHPLLYIHCMLFRYNAHIRRDKYVVANRNLTAVHKLTVYIHEKIFAYRSIVAICTKKRLLHDTVFPRFAQQAAYGFLPRLKIQRMQIVVLVQLFYSHCTVSHKLWVAGLIQQACI